MSRLFNNLGFCSIVIAYVIQESLTPISVSKALLIVPIASNRRLLEYLARKGVRIQNIESLLVTRTDSLANFNQRYYDSLSDSINGIQFLLDIEVLTIREGVLSVQSPMPYHKEMGRRAEKAKKASINIASLLSLPAATLYSSLRIQL